MFINSYCWKRQSLEIMLFWSLSLCSFFFATTKIFHKMKFIVTVNIKFSRRCIIINWFVIIMLFAFDFNKIILDYMSGVAEEQQTQTSSEKYFRTKSSFGKRLMNGRLNCFYDLFKRRRFSAAIPLNFYYNRNILKVASLKGNMKHSKELKSEQEKNSGSQRA